MAKRDMAYSETLSKRPVLHGIVSLFDFHGSMERGMIEKIRDIRRNRAPMPSTEESLRATWQSVGDSVRWAIGEFEKEIDEIDGK